MNVRTTQSHMFKLLTADHSTSPPPALYLISLYCSNGLHIFSSDYLSIITVKLFSKIHDASVRLSECYSIHLHKALYLRQTFHSFHLRSRQVLSDLANRDEISRSNENEAKSQTLRQKLRITYDCFIRMFYGRYLMSF